jgi:NADH-quinone oxidoreductase subunit A
MGADASEVGRTMLGNWLFVALAVLVGSALGIGIIFMGALLRPQRPNRTKLAPYEGGVPGVTSPMNRITPRYYVIAILFVVFDVEAIFIYPWAVIFGALGWYGLVEMFLFIALLLLGWFYAWRKGAFEWA